MSGRIRSRGLRGVTLVELLVVLVLLGLLFTMSGVAMASLGIPRQSVWLHVLDSTRAQAIRSGVPVVAYADSTVLRTAGSRPVAPVLFLPDGRAAGPGVDPLTGAPLARR